MSDKDQFQMTKQDKIRLLIGSTVFLVVWELIHLAMPLLPAPWPPFYWALPVHGQVVDAETGTPLAGVIVVAEWELKAPWVGTVGNLAVMETVTNDQGGFVLRWWRPRLRWPLLGQLSSYSPTLLFFKPGYKRGYCSNQVIRLHRHLNPFPGSECNGQTIRLKKSQDTAQEYYGTVAQLDRFLEFAFHYKDCSWKKIPQMLVTVDREMTLAARKQKIPGIFESVEHLGIELWESDNAAHYGSIKKFLRSYMP